LSDDALNAGDFFKGFTDEAYMCPDLRYDWIKAAFAASLSAAKHDKNDRLITIQKTRRFFNF
jgi:hypothetical protein